MGAKLGTLAHNAPLSLIQLLQKLVGAITMLALRANKPQEFLQKLASLAKPAFFRTF